LTPTVFHWVFATIAIGTCIELANSSIRSVIILDINRQPCAGEQIKTGNAGLGEFDARLHHRAISELDDQTGAVGAIGLARAKAGSHGEQESEN